MVKGKLYLDTHHWKILKDFTLPIRVVGSRRGGAEYGTVL